MPIIDECQVRRATDVNLRLNETQSTAFRRSRLSLTLEETLNEIQRIADLPLEESITLPREAYASEEFFAWECENLFRPGWTAVAHVSQIPLAGDFINLDFLGEPLIVVCDKSGGVRVLSRACPHRGMDIMPPGFGHDGHGPAEFREGGEDRGHTRLFLCPYHSWTFELDGGLKACPEMGQARDFCRADWGLKEFRTEIWNGFIFVNLDGTAEQSVADQYAQLTDNAARWDIANMHVVFESHWDIACNWKILAENFMESYHHAGTHIKTLQPIMPARGTWTEAEKADYIRCHLPYGDKAREQIAAAEASDGQWDAFPPIEGLGEDGRYEWGLVMGYPLFTLVTAPDQVVWYRIEPVATDRLRLMTTVMVPESTTRHPNFAAMLDRGTQEAVCFHLEDMEVLNAVQRSMLSDGYQRGRLSHLEMPVWLIQRYLAAKIRGTKPTLDRPAASGQMP
ncbi:MAG: aromatic ring-hydroxylating dioxygenase subunit alpha [Verrucomicrobiae bacterium]|nr:aromatic ring-hydroxylating dioxygenase subunit alpha [Verrucomicrobiae bacterium]